MAITPAQVQSNEKIYGVPEYLYYGQNDRVDELNQRIEMRHFPDSPMEPNYDPRPVPTKYSLFPIIDRRAPTTTQRLEYPDYNGNINFNPGSDRAPPIGFSQNVDIETVLRNQTFANQNGASRGVYIPSSTSDLYRVTVPVSTNSPAQTHPLLFERQMFDSSPHPNLATGNIGRETFFNNTRTQLRNT